MSILSVKSFPCKLEQPVVVQAPNALRSFGVCVREITEVFLSFEHPHKLPLLHNFCLTDSSELMEGVRLYDVDLFSI